MCQTITLSGTGRDLKTKEERNRLVAVASHYQAVFKFSPSVYIDALIDGNCSKSEESTHKALIIFDTTDRQMVWLCG